MGRAFMLWVLSGYRPHAGLGAMVPDPPDSGTGCRSAAPTANQAGPTESQPLPRIDPQSLAFGSWTGLKRGSEGTAITGGAMRVPRGRLGTAGFRSTAAPAPVLVADVGATSTRLALVAGDRVSFAILKQTVLTAASAPGSSPHCAISSVTRAPAQATPCWRWPGRWWEVGRS